jgi:hypothetical protein
MAALPEPVIQTRPDTMPPLLPPTGRPYNPVVTLNGWTLPWRMNNGVKEFHLVAEPVVREMAPGFKAHLWGYNGQSPGPTIEVVEGDRVRMFVTNKLGELTSVHWHGQRLPNGMDGVTGLTQPGIPPGKTFVYEFVARRPGTFMYHPHADEMVQMAMGMMGFWVTHPKAPAPADRRGRPRLLLPAQCLRHRSRQRHAEDHDHAGLQPVELEQPHLPRHRPAGGAPHGQGAHPHRQPDDDQPPDPPARPRVPGHRHRRRPHAEERTRQYEVTTDIAVGQMRQLDFLADEEGDWAFHCHKSHHTMNAMGHGVPTMIGVDHRGVARQITKLIPDYMVMGERGMKDMTEMEMPLPDNTAPMMAGRARSARWAWAACSACSRCARTSSAATTATRAGTSTRRAPWPTSSPAACPTRRASRPSARCPCRRS